MKSAICLHNATVLTGFSVMHNCAVYIKNDKIADVYNEERFRHKVFSPKVKIIDVKGAYVMPGFIDTHIHGIGRQRHIRILSEPGFFGELDVDSR